MMPDGLALTLALIGLAATLTVAVVQPPWFPESVVAVVAATVLVVTGALSLGSARHAVADLAPTIGFLAALLLISDGCRREGLFDALGAMMARGSQGSPRRLLVLVFMVATGVTAALGLDPTIVLLTPVVFATATRQRMNPTPYVYACVYLVNSASLSLPISNLTNLLAFHASGLSFTHFAALMALPTVGAIAVEWAVLTRFFAAELGRPHEHEAACGQPRLPRIALAVLGATLAGFLFGSPFGIDPLWIATAGAAAITIPALARRTVTPLAVVRAVEPSFLIFVVGLGVIVAAASANGLATVAHSVLPTGDTLPDLLWIAAISAVLANLLNNLPAILILTPALAPSGHGAVLASLAGVNVGPNLTYVGSLATLLWRNILRAEDTDVNPAEFLRLGVATVPAALIAATLLLWFGMKAGL
jgi:arsenical pump membrane protein